MKKGDIIEREKKVALKLSLLSAFFGEVVSGSSPPLEIINPITFLFIWGLYGSGVLLVREVWVRFRGYGSLMLLGVAYGIIEEGVAVKSFFDPNWEDLGKLGEYGRFAGINFVWAVWLSIFHAVFSITIPILLIHALYPEFREKTLLSREGTKKVFAIFIFVVFLIFIFQNYHPPLFQYLAFLLLSVFLIGFASKGVRAEFYSIRFFSLKNNYIFGVLFTVSMFILFFVTPETSIHPLVPCMVAIYLFLILYGRFETINYENFNPKETVKLVLGLLTPFLIFFDIVLELNGSVGMSVVGVVTFLWIFRFLRTL